MADDGKAIGRVCLYAMQQCGLASGCLAVTGDVFGRPAHELTLAALRCSAAGAQLYAGEVRTGEFGVKKRESAARVELRARRINEADRAWGAAAAARKDHGEMAVSRAAREGQEGP